MQECKKCKKEKIFQKIKEHKKIKDSKKKWDKRQTGQIKMKNRQKWRKKRGKIIF